MHVAQLARAQVVPVCARPTMRDLQAPETVAVGGDRWDESCKRFVRSVRPRLGEGSR
jgi:hypothetical protein